MLKSKAGSTTRKAQLKQASGVGYVPDHRNNLVLRVISDSGCCGNLLIGPRSMTGCRTAHPTTVMVAGGELVGNISQQQGCVRTFMIPSISFASCIAIRPTNGKKLGNSNCTRPETVIMRSTHVTHPQTSCQFCQLHKESMEYSKTTTRQSH
eukprot:2413238-Amphidinium_carterae.1